MTQIVVTLANNADENFLRLMIENMKGVVKTTLTHSERPQTADKSTWLDSIHSRKNSIDPGLIDLSDPRTNYIMSK